MKVEVKEKYKIITFKNGKEMNVTQEVVNVLRDQVMKGGADLQVFLHDEINVDLLIKVSEIVCIE